MTRSNRLFLSILLVLLAPGAAAAATSALDEEPQGKAEARQNADPPAKSPPPQQDPGENPYFKRFQELDSNDDGYVSLAEWPLDEAKFHAVDRNKDSRLSGAELLTPNVLRRSALEGRFRDLDRDRDGRLSRGELQRGGEALDSRDRDRDGYVTPYEYSTFQDTWNSRATLQDQRRFRDLDRNRDSRLTRIELGASRAAFERLDRNRDGVISPREWQ